VSVAGTRDALAQDLVVRGVLVDSLVAKGATLAGEARIAGGTETLLHSAGRLTAQLHAPRIDDSPFQVSFHLICVESCSDEDGIERNENGKELRSGHGLSVVVAALSSSQPGFDVLDRGWNVIPALLCEGINILHITQNRSIFLYVNI